MQIDLVKKEEISLVDIQLISTSLKEKIENGEINPLLLKQHFKAVSEIEEQIKETLRNACVEEAAKYPEKKILLFGSEFTKTEVGVSYDYSSCNDPVLIRLQEDLAKAKQKVEKRQKFLQAIDGHETTVDESTGEVLTVYPPVKKSTSTVSCSVK